MLFSGVLETLPRIDGSRSLERIQTTKLESFIQRRDHISGILTYKVVTYLPKTLF
jgi:hypothetical protein